MLKLPSLPTALLALLVTSLVGCADASGPKTRQIIIEVDPTTVIGDAYIDDGGNIIYPDVNYTDYNYILVPAGDTEPNVHVTGQTELAVILLDERGDPVEGKPIDFEIIDDDPGDAQLSAHRTRTDDTGFARVIFKAGEQKRGYTVEVWNASTRRVRFAVHVVDMPSGSLNIGFEYQGPVSIGRLEVYLVPDPNLCEDPYYLAAPDLVEFSTTVESYDDRVAVGPLLVGSRYSILVRGRLAANGVLAAGGCLGDVRIAENEDRRAQVLLSLLPLNPGGTYDLNNHYDFSDAIPGTLGDVIRALVQFFGDQNHEREIASLLFDLVENLAREAAGAIGGLVVGLIGDWVEDDLNEIINNYINNDGPEWLRDFFTIGSDIISIVSNMEVISKMRLSKPRADGSFDGNQNWLGLAFYWRLPCQDNPDPNCGRYAFTMDEVSSAAEGIQLVFGQFTGRVRGYNEGVIDTHTMDLQYGRLILFVLNNLILPWLVHGDLDHGPTNIREALLAMANCPGFARGITGGDGELDIGGWDIASADTIEGWCTSILGLAGDVAASILGRLRIDTRLTLRGEMRFIEETDDLVVDSMEAGAWWGVIRTQEDEGPPFDGDYAGPREQ